MKGKRLPKISIAKAMAVTSTNTVLHISLPETPNHQTNEIETSIFQLLQLAIRQGAQQNQTFWRCGFGT